MAHAAGVDKAARRQSRNRFMNRSTRAGAGIASQVAWRKEFDTRQLLMIACMRILLSSISRIVATTPLWPPHLPETGQPGQVRTAGPDLNPRRICCRDNAFRAG